MSSTKTVAITETTIAKKVAAAEAQLNSIYAAAFSTDSGRKVLEHFNNELRTVEPLGTPELRIIHREGGRFVIRSIINRIEKGKKHA